MATLSAFCGLTRLQVHQHTHLGFFSGWDDQKHNVMLDTPSFHLGSGALKLEFEAFVDQQEQTDESGGINDLRIISYPASSRRQEPPVWYDL